MRAGWRLQGEVGQLVVVVDPKQSGLQVEDARGVERDRHRQPPLLGVGEARDHAGPVRRRGPGDGRRHPGGPDRDEDVGLAEPHPQGRGHVVAGAGGDDGAGGGVCRDGTVWLTSHSTSLSLLDQQTN